MIDVEHLSKSYGGAAAVRDVSFHVDGGEIVGFVGPNGAGKSTTLRILAGFLGPTAGRVRIAGHDIVLDSMKARASLGYMPETSPLYTEMRVAEYLAFRAELKLVPRSARKGAIGRALDDAGARDVEDVIIGELSKGYRQRVGLADALVASPPLLILDEPTAGLDPNQIREVRDLIVRLGRDRTVLLSTHILSEVEATCSRALVIAKGRLVAQGSIDEIRALRRSTAVSVTVGDDAARALPIARKAPGVRRASRPSPERGEIHVELDRGADADRTTEAVVAALVGAGIGVRRVVPLAASLEQVFSELTEAAPPREDDPASSARAADEGSGAAP
jgi:ABC-2 type transport system ATP-binding protein